MKIAIVGAGAMGSMFGGLLAECGNDVTLIDINDAHIGAVQSNGLRLVTDDGDRYVGTLKIYRPEEAREQPELLVIFTKTLHTGAALQGVKHLMSPDVHVLSLQNGLGNVEKISEFASTAIWAKVAFNAALNSICAVSGCTVDPLGLSPEGSRLAEQVVVEVLSVAQRLGIEVDPAKCKANVAGAIARHKGHKPSMLQDVQAGRRTEIEAINGAAVTAAERFNMKLPTTETLLSLVRLVEARATA